MSEKLCTEHEAENLFLDAYVLPGELAKDRSLAARLGRPPHVPFVTDDNGEVGYRFDDLWAAVRAARATEKRKCGKGVPSLPHSFAELLCKANHKAPRI